MCHALNYIQIDKTIKKAYYLQIRDSIKHAIQQGVLSDMDRLPTEHEICEVFGISDIVVKNAYKLLVQEGLVTRIQGSGTYVSTRKVFRFPLKGFSTLSSFESFNYQSKEKRIILFEETQGDENIHFALEQKEPAPYYIAKYIILVENAEVLLQTLYLPKALYKGLVIDDIMDNNLPKLIERRYGYTMHRVKSGFHPVNLSPSEVLLMNTYKNAAAHRVKTSIYDVKDTLIAYLDTLFLGEYTQFEVVSA
jgi:GntR family transcriptional regulator